jgi:ferredoxin
MAKLTFMPDRISIDVDDSLTMREAAHLAGIDVQDRCGGNGACCNCIVTVLEGAEYLNPKTFVEAAVTYLAANDRLSCQCKLNGGLVVVQTC